MEGISYGLWGQLGGATRQAAHKSGNPVRWLQARIRRGIQPHSPRSARSLARTYQVGVARVAATIEAVANRIGSGPDRETHLGRPRKESADQLARLLQVDPGGSILDVFARWLHKELEELRKLSVEPGHPWGRASVMRFLDARWLPRWANKPTGPGSAPRGRRWGEAPEAYWEEPESEEYGGGDD